MNIEFDGEPVYGDNDKYIRQKQSHMEIRWIQIFNVKSCQRKMSPTSVCHW